MWGTSCAWVLWTKTESLRLGERRTVEWDFDRKVYDARAEWESAVVEERARIVKFYSEAGALLAQRLLGERMMIVEKWNDPSTAEWSVVFKHSCLPDLLDPRGPRRNSR